MNDSENGIGQEPEKPDKTDCQSAHVATCNPTKRRQSRLGWIKLIIQPVLFLAFGVGVARRSGHGAKARLDFFRGQ